MVDAKLQKAAIKEGGKKGVDLQGVEALGGVSFFNLAVEVPEGDLELLEFVLEGANAEVDESAEERKGGAGGLGKLFLSAGAEQLAIIAHVPKKLAEARNTTAKEWVDAVIKVIPNAVIVSETEELVKVTSAADKEKGIFPLKLRDEAISLGVAFLREKGLLPADNESSDDDVNYAEAAGVEW